MKARHRAVLSALGMTLASTVASASVLDSLSVADHLRIDAGETVVRAENLPGSSWPAVTVYQLVSATPEAALAIFTDYDEQTSYLEDCCGVKESRVLDPAVSGDHRVQRVRFEIEVPVFSNERYELREEISKGADGSYRVVWGKVSSGGHSDAIFGRAVFEPHGGQTLFSYYNFTRITSFGAGAFADASVTRTRRTVDAIARHIEQESASGGAGFRADLARIRAALGG